MNHPSSASAGTTPASAALRRLATAVLGLVLMATTLAIASAPAGASVPGAPRAMKAIGYGSGIRVYFAPPLDNGGNPVTKYTISRVRDPFIGPQIPKTWTQTDTAVLFDTTAVSGLGYRYWVTATNADGDSAVSDGMKATRNLLVTDYGKFGFNYPTFINRNYHDFLGRMATPSEQAAAQFALSGGSVKAYQFIDDLAGQDSRLYRKQVIRLYFAFFKRGPDHGGLNYWTTQLNAHTKGLDDVANSFASSNEFKTTYGSLTDLDFVTLVYHNVLDRDPDATGLSFWLGQLSSHSVIRGRVMTQFSESNEFKVSSHGRVTAADLWDAMLGQAIPDNQLSLIGGHVQGGGTVGLAATYIISLPLYTVV